jgi:hypothetical protein
MSANPWRNPGALDFYTLDGTRPPGISWIDGGGERTEEFQDQPVPLTTGATTIFRFEPNGEVTYTHKLWNNGGEDQIAAWDIFVAMLNEGKQRRPRPRVYTLADERLVDVKMTSVSLKSIGPRQVRRGGEMLVKVTYKEVRRQKPYGGVAAPADDPAVANAIKSLQNDIQAKRDALAAHDTARAARAGK